MSVRPSNSRKTGVKTNERETIWSVWRAPESDSWDKIEWLRPTEIAEFKNGNLAVFSGGIEPADIKQGMLGDCYFLSVLAALTETPSRIEKLFKMEMELKLKNWSIHN